MDTESALLASIIANPADDLPRLVFADWLDENGQPDLAEFIRCQVQIAAWGCDFKQTPEQPGWKHLCGTDANGYWLCQPLRSRAREHLEKHADQWFPVPSGFGFDWDIAAEGDADPLRSGYVINRGFVHTVRCRLADWIGGECGRCIRRDSVAWDTPGSCLRCGGRGTVTGIGPAVVAAHPVGRVMTDRDPMPPMREDGDDGWTWWNADAQTGEVVHEPSELPQAVYGLLVGHNLRNSVIASYRTRELAIAALSSALIAWAKSQPHPARLTATPVSVGITTGDIRLPFTGAANPDADVTFGFATSD